MSPPFMFPNVRAFITIFFVLTVLAGSAADSIYSDYTDTVERRYAMVRDMAKVVESHVHRTIKGADTAILLTARMIEDAGGLSAIQDHSHWQRLRDYAAQVDGGRLVWVFDAEGNTILETGRHLEWLMWLIENISSPPKMGRVYLSARQYVPKPAIR